MMDKDKELLEWLYQMCGKCATELRNCEKGWINVVRSLPKTEENVLVHLISRENPSERDINISMIEYIRRDNAIDAIENADPEVIEEWEDETVFGYTIAQIRYALNRVPAETDVV